MKQITRDGRKTERDDGQDRLLAALYGSTAGRLLLKPLTHPAVSRAAGWLLSTRASCLLIGPFIRRNHIDMTQFEEEKYASYNEFFSRKIRPDARRVDREPGHLISPCDSKLTVLPVEADGRFSIKHTQYTLAELLKSEELAAEYVGGTALLFRLTVDDYHRYCYPADGSRGGFVAIPGIFHTVNPVANDYYPIYKENAREYCILHTRQFGDMVMMEVGALLVGKIVNHPGSACVKRGQEKGYFRFGGSTVLVLLKRGAAMLDPDLLENSRQGWETVVRYGEKIGRANET